MALKNYNPTSAARRFLTSSDYSELSKKRPEKRLVGKLYSARGRNSQGRETNINIGRFGRQLYRFIDFKRDKIDIPATVEALEYDPNRTARLALLCYKDGERRYILAPDGLSKGDGVIASPRAEIRTGNALPLINIPVGTMIHNVEVRPGKGGQLIRSAGGQGQLLARENGCAQIRMPSGEVRIVPEICYATIGQVGNLEHENIVIGKAGRSRWLGIRPHNRGVSKNPVDHPMGGGEGKTSGGRHPCSPTGLLAKGKKTRNNKRTDRFIIHKKKK